MTADGRLHDVSTPTPPTARRSPPALLGHAIWIVLQFVVGVFTQLFGNAFRTGRVQMQRRPAGTRTLRTLVVALYAVSVGVILFAERIRRNTVLSITADGNGQSNVVPRVMLWLMLFILVVCTALLMAGALHTVWWFKVVAFGIALVMFASISSGTGGARGGILIASGSMVALGVYAWLRHRSPSFPAWDVTVTILLLLPPTLWGTIHARDTQLEFGTDFLPVLVQLALQPALQLLIILAVVGGAGVADFALTAAEWTTTFVRTHLHRRTLAVGLLALVVWRAWGSVRNLADDLSADSGDVIRSQIGAVLLVAMLFAFWIGMQRLARAIGDADATPVEAIRSAFGKVGLPIAAALVLTSIISIIGLLLTVVGNVFDESRWGSNWTDWWTWLTDTAGVRAQRILVGVVLVALSFWFARRGRRAIGEMSGVIGIVLLVNLSMASGSILDGIAYHSGELDRAGLVVTLVLIGRWAVTRTLTPVRIERLVLVLILTALLDERSFITDPVGKLIGFTGIGFVLFGFVWSFLTGGQSANEGSAKFPRDNRMLLFYARSLYGIALLAFAAVARDSSLSETSGRFSELGDSVLGVPLLLAALFALLVAATREEPWPVAPPPAAPAADIVDGAEPDVVPEIVPELIVDPDEIVDPDDEASLSHSPAQDP